jgi:hypothetical protein
MRVLKGSLVLSALALGAQPAMGITVGTPTMLCISSGGFNHCMTATVTLTGSGIDVLVENMSGVGFSDYDLHSIGFYYMTADGTPSLAFTTQAPPAGAGVGIWSDGMTPPLSVQVPAGGTALGGASTEAANPLEPGNSVTLSFTLTGDLPEEFFIGFRGQSAYGGEGSFYCWETGESSTDNGDEVCGATVIPEPGSMLLLATGLVGLGGAGLIRRRRAAKV